MPFRFGESTGRSIRTIGALSTVGIMLVLAVAIGAGCGILLDRWLGSSPLMFLVFFFLGMAAGVRNVFRMASKFLDKK